MNGRSGHGMGVGSMKEEERIFSVILQIPAVQMNKLSVAEFRDFLNIAVRT